MNPRTTVTLRTGNKMPIIGLGTWCLTEHTAEIIEMALKLGYAMIDTSGDYGTQPGVGEGIKRSGVRRDSFYLVTKVEEDEDAYEAVKKNLKELQLEYADLILIHRPPPTGAGEDLWEGLMRAKKEELTKDIGVSNYSAELIDKLIEATGEVPVVNQIEWSPFGHSEHMLSYARENGIVIQAYSPLTRAKRLSDSTLADMASKYHKTPAQVAIRWNIQLGAVPLPKASSKKHLEENITVFDFELTDDDMTKLNDLNERYSSLGAFRYV